MKVATFKAKCNACREEFSCPSLGDFSYGSFLFTGKKGTVFAVFHVFEQPIWNYLESTLPLPKAGLSRQADCEKGDRIRAACAYFADHISGQELGCNQVCPRCHSAVLEFWGHEQTGAIDIEEADYTKFMSLPEDIVVNAQ